MAFDLTPVDTGSSSRYASRMDLDDMFGATNIATWAAPVSGSSDTSEARIARALGQAADAIDDLLRGGPYALPLGGGAGMATVITWAATLAGASLYSSAQVTTSTAGPVGGTSGYFSPLPPKLATRVRADIEKYKAGILVLDVARIDPSAATAPTIVV